MSWLRSSGGTQTACAHLPTETATPSGERCEECGSGHSLRMCATCGHVGCCDNSPNRHATAHWHATEHPLIRSYEPGEDWWWCYPEELFFEVEGASPAPSHP